ncbi:glutathione S-transferase family protein [Thalassomonas sp. M1454]|uniref:glutathione S-transferase family protein n=1 Tax=Thalassomonas sp. M1454 TaxID=2594477 RepID=UPI00117FEE36|nr:glutathione S-transferase family protein [Thalassomonas sp. M1454]TRX55860.1 glutathione S-transferase family protein [Thalassomonas sp. M1454]
MILYGSTTSPFVRRIRIFTQAIPLEFRVMDIFAAQDRKKLIAQNPTLKVPFLVDDEVSVFDSRVIHRYISEKFELTSLSWKQENTLTLIDSVSDTLVAMFLLTKSDFDTSADKLFFKLQHQRTANVLAALEKECEQGSFDDWHYPSICLYCLIDWAQFREMVDFSDYPELIKFWQKNNNREEVVATDPRD